MLASELSGIKSESLHLHGMCVKWGSALEARAGLPKEWQLRRTHNKMQSLGRSRPGSQGLCFSE